MIKKRIGVFTWNNELVILVSGKVLLQHLIGSYYTARIGYGSLLKLDYCIHFERIYSKRGIQEVVYSLLKKSYASSVVRSKAHNMRRGILSTLTRGASLRILLRQLPKTGAINLPLHRYKYQLVAVCLVDANGEILDINAKCHPQMTNTRLPKLTKEQYIW